MFPTKWLASLGRLVLVVSLLLFVAIGEANDTTAVGRNELNEAQSRVVAGEASEAIELFDLQALLGLNKANYRWVSRGPQGEAKTPARVFVIAFNQPIELGSVFWDGTPTELRALKPNAANVDLNANNDWETISIPRSQGGGVLVPLPVGLRTKALAFVDSRDSGQAELRTVRLFKERLLNVTPWSLAYADREFTPPNTDFVPNPASSIPAGQGFWVNVGKNQNGLVAAPPVSDVAPSWFMLTWPDAKKLTNLWLHSNATKYDIEVFTGPSDVHPRAGLSGEWRKIREPQETVLWSQMTENARLVTFAPVATRAVRVRMTKTQEGPIAAVRGLHAMSLLEDQPVPASPSSEKVEPPIALTFETSEPRNATFVIDGPDGRRAKNVFARSALPAGKQDVGWDLKDENGAFVTPGKYRWTALTWPDLRLKYEMTVYPNVSQHAPQNAPWLTGTNGSGGWLADHTPPCSGCVAGDRVFLGAYVAESGVSLIECDLDGRKQWGHHSFAAWTGARFLASDGKLVFAAAPILGTSNESVWVVNPEDHSVKNLLSLTPTASHRRGMQGIAARDSKLFMSVRGAESWLTTAAAGDDVDLKACAPLYPPRRKPRAAYEIVPDPQGDFVRLFRLSGTPPGGATQFTATHLETQSGPGQQQHIVLAFQRAVPIGSVVFPRAEMKDTKLMLSVLKPNAPYPPNAEDSKQWQPFASVGDQAWDCVAAPEKTLTRALRITFSRGSAADDDPLAKALESPGGKKEIDFDLDTPKKPSVEKLLGGSDKSAWKGRLEGMKLLRRRFANVAGTAELLVSSGKVADDGSWDARRSAPLTEEEPGVYALTWNEPQKLRGLAIKEIDGALTKIDAFTGDGEIDITSHSGWEQVGEYRQQRRDMHSGFESCNALARYIDGEVDFGREVTTRAIRLRVVAQWTDRGERGDEGLRPDLGGNTIDATRCRIWGVAALKYLGGEPSVESASTERLEVYDTSNGKLLQEVALPQPGEVVCGPKGEVFAISKKQIVRVDLSAGHHTPFISDVLEPTDFAFDAEGLCYVFDNAADRHHIRVFDRAGKFVRSIGTDGGFKVGAWDATRFGDVVSLDVDSRGQLWCVEGQYHPKRVTVWTSAGKFVKELLGNTPYGGGGVLDPANKNRLFYGPLEFELDWQTGQSRLKNLLWQGSTPPGEVPLAVDGRTYLVTRPMFQEMQIGVVYLYEKDHVRLAAAVGRADQFEPLKAPAIMKQLGNKPLTEHRFVWSDLNSDGEVQADEVKLTLDTRRSGVTNFNRDLGVQHGSVRYQVSKFLPSGVPVYEEAVLEKLTGRDYFRLDDGSFYAFSGDRVPDGAVTADGRIRWTYPQDGWGVQSLQNAKPYQPGQVVSQFGIVGHETAPQLGEFLVVHGNNGAWNVWTADGLLAGPIFRDLRDSKARPWSMAEHTRGMAMNDVTAGQEHFSSSFCKTSDGRFYVVAGHNHISLLEVQGFDQFQRQTGEFEVTPAELQKARQFDDAREQSQIAVRAPIIDAYRMKKPPEFDGKLTGFGPAAAQIGNDITFHIGFNDEHLFVGWRARGQGPLKNSGSDWQRLFKSGAACDLLLATDPDAASDRQSPVSGDVRVLLSYIGNKSLAVLYRPVAPGASSDKALRVTSPVGETIIDHVEQLTSARMLRTIDPLSPNQYTLEAAIPLKAIGLKATGDLRLKMDWGLLVSGPEGHDVLRRVYWANQATQIIADAPSEARLTPHLWGHILFHDHRPSAEDRLADDAINGSKKPTKAQKDAAEELLDDLKKK